MLGAPAYSPATPPAVRRPRPPGELTNPRSNKRCVLCKLALWCDLKKRIGLGVELSGMTA